MRILVAFWLLVAIVDGFSPWFMTLGVHGVQNIGESGSTLSMGYDRDRKGYDDRRYSKGGEGGGGAGQVGSNGIGRYIRGGRDNSIRQSRVARTVKIEVADIIGDVDIKAVNYPDEDLLRGTSVVDVDISPDLSYAKVFITILGNAVERRQVYVWLCENAGQVRYSLARRLRHMKRVPDLYFKLADSQAAADLVNLIEELGEEMRVNEEGYFEDDAIDDMVFEEDEEED